MAGRVGEGQPMGALRCAAWVGAMITSKGQAREADQHYRPGRGFGVWTITRPTASRLADRPVSTYLLSVIQLTG